MTRLTKQELIEIQYFIDKKVEIAEGMGLRFSVDDDMWKWKEVVDAAPGGIGGSRTLDPMFNDLSVGNSFWIKLKDRNGDIVGCLANRFIETEDFVEEFVATHRLFENRCPSLQPHPIQLKESVPVLRGRMSFGGGSWVHPDWRRIAIAGLMSRVSRALALRHYLIDCYVCFITATSNHRLYGVERLGLPNRRHLLTGEYPGREGNLDVDIYWMHRGEIMAQVSSELASFEDEGDAPMIRTA